MDNVKTFPGKKNPAKEETTSIAIKDIDCLALLTNKDEQFYIDDPAHIAQVIAIMRQRGIKWKREEFPNDK